MVPQLGISGVVGVKGPLAGVRIIEMAGLGTVPFAAMLLGDLGAEILRIDRPGDIAAENPVLGRNCSSLPLDLKSPGAIERLAGAIARADVLIEGYRPGVMERLGVGPAKAFEINPRLVYGRITGWGQTGPLATVAGHDINYIALAGALDPLGPDKNGPPLPPLNLVGDYGGALYLVMGILAALFERSTSGCGQVVDAAIVDSAASMIGALKGYAAAGRLVVERGGPMSGAAPNFRCYRCADGGYVAVGCVEPRFYRRFFELLGWPRDRRPDLSDPAVWPEVSADLEALFLTRSQNEWAALLETEDVCVSPVLQSENSALHPHIAERGTWAEREGAWQPAAVPKFSRSTAEFTPDFGTARPDGESLLGAWLQAIP